MKRAAQNTLLAFFVAIMIGTTLLALPAASATGESIGFVDALFTATSATCVTGLIVLDTGADFTLFGQAVILALIQFGGLGIMTLSVGVLLAFGMRGSLRHKAIFAEDMADVHKGDYRDTIKFIFIMTMSVKFIGFLCLLPPFVGRDGLAQGTWSSAFHSVSAFCNAGFSLYSDSLVGFQANAWVNLVMGGLIVLGGIGFVVLWDLLGWARERRRKRAYRLALHTKLALTASAGLILFGAAMILIIEHNVSFAGMDWPTRLMASLFQSVTARTAGFNTVPMRELSSATLFGLIGLMFVGACPFSTGGGIKTTTFVVILAVAVSRLRGKGEPVVAGRSFSPRIVSRAITLTFMAGVVVFLFAASIIAVELGGMSYEATRGSFLLMFFETVSAFGTVGLSLGATPELSVAGRILVTVLMYIGRVGPLALVAALSRQKLSDVVRYPSEDVGIG